MSNLSGAVAHDGNVSVDELALDDVRDCIKWELACLCEIPGRAISIALDLQSKRHFTLHVDVKEAGVDRASDPASTLGAYVTEERKMGKISTSSEFLIVLDVAELLQALVRQKSEVGCLRLNRWPMIFLC